MYNLLKTLKFGSNCFVPQQLCLPLENNPLQNKNERMRLFSTFLWRHYEVWQLLELESYPPILACDFQVSIVPCSDMKAIDSDLIFKNIEKDIRSCPLTMLAVSTTLFKRHAFSEIFIPQSLFPLNYFTLFQILSMGLLTFREKLNCCVRFFSEWTTVNRFQKVQWFYDQLHQILEFIALKYN